MGALASPVIDLDYSRQARDPQVLAMRRALRESLPHDPATLEELYRLRLSQLLPVLLSATTPEAERKDGLESAIRLFTAMSVARPAPECLNDWWMVIIHTDSAKLARLFNLTASLPQLHTRCYEAEKNSAPKVAKYLRTLMA